MTHLLVNRAAQFSRACPADALSGSVIARSHAQIASNAIFLAATTRDPVNMASKLLQKYKITRKSMSQWIGRWLVRDHQGEHDYRAYRSRAELFMVAMQKPLRLD